MKNRNAVRKIIAIGGAACLALSVMVSPIASLPVQAAAPGNEEVSPQHDIIQWVYDIRDGGLYRRLFNVSLNLWLTDWEYVCPA